MLNGRGTGGSGVVSFGLVCVASLAIGGGCVPFRSQPVVSGGGGNGGPSADADPGVPGSPADGPGDTTTESRNDGGTGGGGGASDGRDGSIDTGSVGTGGQGGADGPTGGAVSGGGGMGGMSTGGTATGGAASGGRSTGGASTGGAASGGRNSGGASSGGATSGGSASGGAPASGGAGPSVVYNGARTQPMATSFEQISVSCPSGTTTSGAGVAIESASGAIVDGSATYFLPAFDGSGWLVNGSAVMGASPWSLHVTAACASFPGYELVTMSTPIDTTARKTLSVTCPAGKQAIGAGWAALDPTAVIETGQVLQFQVSPDGLSWSAAVTNLGVPLPTWMARVTVMCATAGAIPGYQVVSVDGPLAVTARQTLTVACPAPKLPLSAGWTALDAAGTPLDSQTLFAGYTSNGWSVTTSTPQAVNQRLQVRVICAN